MKKEVIAHLKGDIKDFKKEASEDRALIKKLKSKHKKHEKRESKKHEKKEHKKKHVKKVSSKKSRKESPKFRGKVEKVMHEFKGGSLHSGSKKGPKVKSRKQAIAIALSEARKATKK